jgi:hypothetical protein
MYMYIFSISTSILAPSAPHTDSHRVPLDSLTRTPKDQKFSLVYYESIKREPKIKVQDQCSRGKQNVIFIFIFLKNNGTEERKDIGGEGERILGGGTG